ncbi:FHA domain-containing protein [Bdellovibrionota bacterium FG-2]
MSHAPLLTILKDGETLRSVSLEGESILGRNEECSIRIDDRAISREHVSFRPVAGGVQVQRKSEFAPMSVNGVECVEAVLKDGDLLMLGSYWVRVSLNSGGAQDSPGGGMVASTVAPTVAMDSHPEAADLPPRDLELVEENGEAVALAKDEALGEEADPFAPPADSSPEGDEGQVALAEDASAQANSESPSVDLDAGDVSEDGKTKVNVAPKVMVKLVFSPGTANVTEYELSSDEVTIGRGSECTIVLNEKKASRRHAIVLRAGLNFVIRDLDSANGTYVNGHQVREHELSGEDRIRIGAVEFVFKALSLDYAAQEQNFMAVSDQIEEAEPEVLQEASQDAPYGALNSAPFEQAQNPASEMAAAPMGAGMGTLPGFTGIGGVGGSAGKGKLLEKFRALPKPRQYLIILVVIVGGYMLFFDEEEKAAPAKGAKKAAIDRSKTQASPGPLANNTPAFENLTPEQKRFVESQHALAFDYYRNREYDKSLFEIGKIFALISDYKDSREIERYAKEGKRKLDAFEDEKRKKEDEAKLRVRIAQLVDETRSRMGKKQYEQAKELFAQVLEIDPDNTLIAGWRKEIEAFEEQTKQEEMQKQVQTDINKHAWDVYREAMALRKVGKFHSAIEVFQKAIDVGASDKKVHTQAKAMIQGCRQAIRDLRDPVLKEAQGLETSGDLPKAFALFKKATHIDPPHKEGYAGMERIRGVLHGRAKGIYTEAVLAESYSDFTTARKKFHEVLEVAPNDDVYHERAQRKLANYFRKDDAPQ